MSITAFLGGSLPIAPVLAAATAAQTSADQSVATNLATTSPISLGDFDFDSFDIPESINYGVSQRLQTHRFIGGGQQIDAMGEDHEDIAWKGMLFGSEAQARRLSLQALVDGRAKDLAWGINDISVVVESVTFEEKGPYEIDYSIKCRVLTIRDITQDTTPLAQVTGRDISVAATQVPTAGLGEVQGLLRTAQTIRAGTDQAMAVVARLRAARGCVQAILARGSSTLAAVQNIGQGGVFATIESLNNASLGLEAVTRASAANAYVGRAISNLTFGRR